MHPTSSCRARTRLTSMADTRTLRGLDDVLAKLKALPPEIVSLRSCGVYAIVNLVNGKLYIGSTSHSFAKRFRNHRHDLARGAHHCVPLQRAWIKYGETAFSFVPLEVLSPDLVLLREQALMDGLMPEYNLAPTAGSSRGVRHSEKSRQNMSAAQRKLLATPGYLERRTAGVREACATQESRQRRSEAQKRVVTRSAASMEMWASEGFRVRNVAAMRAAQARPEVKVAKSAATRARNIANSPLTPVQVAEIVEALALGRRGVDLARQFGVGQSTISRIKQGSHWAIAP